MSKYISSESSMKNVDSKHLFGNKSPFQSRKSSKAYDPDDTRSESSTLVDFRSDSSSVLTKNSYYGPSQNDKLPVVAEMLDPEDAAWGPPHAHSSPYRPHDSSSSTTSTPRWWSQKWQSRTRQGSNSSSRSSRSNSNSSQGWAQDFDPEDQAWTRRK